MCRYVTNEELTYILTLAFKFNEIYRRFLTTKGNVETIEENVNIACAGEWALEAKHLHSGMHHKGVS